MNHPISMKFGKIMHNGLPRQKPDEKSKFYKFDMANGRHIENNYSLHISSLFPINAKYDP